MLGETFDGVVGSDRYKAYLSIPIERRQVCWAHLKRDLTAFAERGGEIGDWGTEAVGVVEKVFAAWYRFKEGETDRPGLRAEIAPLRAQMQGLWERGTMLPSWIVRALCNDVRKLEPVLWTFVMVEGAEPTNNAAERALRPPVLWYKRQQGLLRRGQHGREHLRGKDPDCNSNLPPTAAASAYLPHERALCLSRRKSCPLAPTPLNDYEQFKDDVEPEDRA